MKQDARMAWYMAASRRPALLKRESLIKLHSTVNTPETITAVKNSEYQNVMDLSGKQWTIIPLQLPTAQFKIGSVISLNISASLSSDQIKSIQQDYFIVHLDNWVCGVEHKDGSYRLVVLNTKDKPPFDVYDFLVVYPEDIENFPGNKFTTTCGRYLINYYLIASTFLKNCTSLGELGALSFVNDQWKINRIESIIARLLINKKITIAACNQYIDHGYFLSSLSELYGSTMTKKSITPDKSIVKLRNKLYEKYKGQLKDPRIGTIIENEMIAADKEQLKHDPSMAFLGDSGKKFDVHRKRQHLAMGLLEDFDSTKGNYQYIQESLSEGWNPKSFVAICNEIRKGSYDRGVETQIAGLDTKWMMAVFQNCKITGDDCGTTRTLPITINKAVAASYFGVYVQSDKNLLANPKFMDFSKEESVVLANQQYLYTTRAGDDQKRYQIGEVIVTPWKKIFVVSSKTEYSNISDCPIRYLDNFDQLKKLTGKSVTVFRLDELDATSKYTVLTENNYQLYLNKLINIRSMQYCQQPDGFCKICAGKIFDDLDFNNLGTLPIDVGSVFLKLPMKSMHGTKVKSFELILNDLEKYVIV